MNLNIPIYRAKKIDSDKYIEGFLIKENTGIFIQNEKGNGFKIIDPSTLAIHFKDMLDSDGEKIFASLDSEKGIGGDIIDIGDGYWEGSDLRVYFDGSRGAVISDERTSEEFVYGLEECPSSIKIIGIQK